MTPNLSNVAALRPLKLVAYLFVICGAFSIIDTIVGLFSGRFVFNLGVLYILVGFGLLRLNPRWLAWAIFFTWMGLIFTPLAGIVSVYLPIRLQHMYVLGFYAGQVPHSLIFTMIAAIFTVFCWQYSVLKSRPVLQLFNTADNTT